MNDLRFPIELRWSGTGRDGAGEILTDDVTLDLSAPQTMGGRGVGTNPEELLVSAVSSCYTATLSAALDRAKLPVHSLAVYASGSVTGLPSYEVGSVQVLEAAPLAMTSDEARAHGERADRDVVGPRSPDARKARAST